MSPTSESRFFVGRNALSATLRTINIPPSGITLLWGEAYDNRFDGGKREAFTKSVAVASG
jgi:hypothetical protein